MKWMDSTAPQREGHAVDRILITTSTFPRWANDPNPPFVFELARRLAGRFEVHVLAPHAEGLAPSERLDGLVVHRYRYAPSRWEQLAYHGGILESLKQNRLRYALVPLFVLGQAAAIRRLQRRFQFAAIHAHWLLPQGLAALLAAGRSGPPALVTCHGADLFSLRQPGMPGLKRWVLTRSAAVTVVSGAMRTEIHRLDSAVEAEVIPMGTDLATRFTPPPAGQARDPATLLFVGRLVEKKGVHVLLQAFSEVRRRLPDARLLIVGEGPGRADLERMTSELQLTRSVSFLGPRPQAELPACYRRATLAIVPSVVAPGGDQEGLGLVIVEAMGCTCPVVASDLPAIRDLARQNETARLVPPGDPVALASAIVALIGDPQRRQRLAQAARLHVERDFDWAVVVQRYRRLIERLICESGVCRVSETSS